MSGIIGEICDTELKIKRVFTKRKKLWHEQSVSHGQVESLIQQGWESPKPMKTRTRLIKRKKGDELFEDRVWRIFYNLKFDHINRDRNLKLDFDHAYRPKQIDVIAKDEDNVFVVECRSTEADGTVNARTALEEWFHKREVIKKAIESSWGRKIGRINLVVAISSKEKRPIDYEYAKQNRDKNIFLWSAKEIEYIESLIKQVGPAAKYQLYSVLFAGKKQKSLKAPCLAIKGNLAGNKFYTFLISAKKLIKYAYVHHRELTGIVEASQVYQRMLRLSKLRKIASFIDIEGGFFPNSIIVNFSMARPLRFDMLKAEDDIKCGTLYLPGYYGSAWIIDGQHRLYGAAKAKRDVLVPVLAFENIDQIEQANLFVEINEQQTSVQRNLLWDLYSDIYRDSDDAKQKFLYQVAETAKKLNATEPLKNCVEIPSAAKIGNVKLTLTTVCEAIKRCSPCWNLLQHPKSESKTPENAALFISAYFDAARSLWPEDWAKGNNGVLLSNNGLGVFMLIFRDIVKYIGYKSSAKFNERPLMMQPSRLSEFKEHVRNNYLKPVIGFLRTDKTTQEDIRSKTGRGPQDDHAGYLEIKIQEFVQGFSSTLLDQVPEVPIEKEPPALSKIERKAQLVEKHFREFILENLKRCYGGEKWWRQGLPGDIKRKVDDRWKSERERKPGLRHEKKTNEDKFEFLDLGKLMQTAIYGQNWDNMFKDIFGSKTHLERRIKDVMALRNPSTHWRSFDDQDVVDGTGGLLWLSNCMGMPDLNPYT